MSNLINTILTSEKATTSTAATSTTDQAVKDKPSLFDSLLSAGTTTEDTEVKQEKKETKSDTSAVIKSEEVKSDEVIDDNLNKKESDVTEEVDNKGQKTVGTSSLLDRLILEAKNSAKDISNGENQVGDTLKDQKPEEIVAINVKGGKVNTEVKTEQIAVLNEEGKVVDKSNAEEVNITEKVDNKGKKETETTSLLDRLILEVKDGSKEVNDLNNNIDNNAEVIKEQVKVSTEVKPEEVITEIKSEETKSDNKKTEIKSEETKSDNKKTEIKNDITKLIDKTDVKTEVDITITDKKTKNASDVLKDISAKKEDNTTSLLDDLLVESNNILVDTSVKETVSDSSSQLSDKSKNIDLNVKNQSLTSTVNEDSNINNLEKNDIKKDVKLSFMDQLIQKNSEKLTVDNINGINEDLNISLKDVGAKDLISNIYLGSQKNKITNQNLFNKNEAISLLKDGNSIQAVKTSAEMLDLGLESVNVEQDIGLDNLDIKKSNIDILNRKNLIDNLLVKNDIRGEEVKDLITKSIDASNALVDNTLTVADDTTVNVNSPLSYNIQSRIIGAKQQMSAMMSDIAKQMYENYKPPVTAFKINLNPLDLGSIAILMKNDKSNGLSISMSVSNNVTLDTLIENQNVLKNSLSKTFDENTKFNLDFGSSNQNNSSNNQSSNNGQSNNRRFEQQMDTKSILELQEENKDREEKVIDYM
jgi:hypothetical protein